MHIGNLPMQLHTMSVHKCRHTILHKFLVKCFAHVVLLLAGAIQRRCRCGLMQECIHVEQFCCWVVGRDSFQKFCMSDHIIHSAETKQSHVLTDFFGDKFKEGDNVFGLTCKAFAEFGLLCGNAYGTCIQVTFAHENTSRYHERRSRETIFFCTE